MALTYELIATATPTTAAATFTSIPQTYTHLLIVCNSRVTSSWDVQAFQFNGSPSGYSGTYIEGSESTLTAGRGSAEIAVRAGYIPGTNYSGVWSSDKVYIFNYSDAANFKTAISSNRMTFNIGFAIQEKVALWQNANAITSIVYGTANGGNYASGTTIKLFGIKAA